MTPIELRELILNTTKPLLLEDFKVNWSCFSEGLENWCQKYDAASDKVPLNFERMRLTNGQTPQWESQREQVRLSLNEFLSEHCKEQTYWTGLNYIRAVAMPEACRAGIDFSCFGFSQGADDCSFWLGSTGANTPCHYDTYGCNIVVQIYGEKSWLLFPPETDLTATRIPYEESSVYCTENFYSPQPAKLKQFEKLQQHAHHCVLKSGDALIVPKHWWHYVEALSNSLSINYWIPLASDAEPQLEECIIKYLIEHLVDKENDGELSYLLNPNQLDQIATDDEMFNILEHLVRLHIDSEVKELETKKSTLMYDYQYQSMSHVEEQIKSMPNMKLLSPMEKEVFAEVLKKNSLRFSSEVANEEPKSPVSWIKEALINSICQPAVVSKIKEMLLERCRKQETQ